MCRSLRQSPEPPSPRSHKAAGVRPDSGEGARPPIGSETELLLSDQDLPPTAAAAGSDTDEVPAAPGPAEPSAGHPPGPIPGDASEHETGWRLLDAFRRKKKPDRPPGAGADPDDEDLRRFLKDS